MSEYQVGDLAILHVESRDGTEGEKVHAVHVGNGWVGEDRMFYPDDNRSTPSMAIVTAIDRVVDVVLPKPDQAGKTNELLLEVIADADRYPANTKVLLGPIIEAYGRMERRFEREVLRQEGLSPDEQWPTRPISRADVKIIFRGDGPPPLVELHRDDKWSDSDGVIWTWDGHKFLSQSLEVRVGGMVISIPEGHRVRWHPEKPPIEHQSYGWDNGEDHIHHCGGHAGPLHVCGHCNKTTPAAAWLG